MSSVVEKIARLFGGKEACEAEARKCGLVVRESKLGGMEFLLVFTHGFCNVPDATLDQMSQFLATACGVKINPQSIDERIRRRSLSGKESYFVTSSMAIFSHSKMFCGRAQQVLMSLRTMSHEQPFLEQAFRIEVSSFLSAS